VNESFDGLDVIGFLRQLLKEVRGKTVLPWDSGSIHRRKEVKEFLWEMRRRLKARRFPTYAPEMNPDEFLGRP